ncbi:MAG TPA: DegT/DnrJ/EryC1/StrS family aminotransferase [Pseudonocardia sp.]
MTQPTRIPFLDLAGLHRELREPLDLAWRSVVDHGKFVGGPEVARFETAFANYCEVGHCAGVGNGTDAIELALMGLGIGAGAEVIVPTNTFVATAEAVCAVGATPRFVDVLPDTLLLDPAATEAAIGPRTAAIIAVHLFGQMADVVALSGLAERHGLHLIEDAAQAHGATYAGRKAGSWGSVATFSFYPGKNLGALGDGGAVVSDDAELITRIRRLADHGRSEKDRYAHIDVGRNSRLDTVQAALLLAKLPSLDQGNKARAAAVERYRAGLPSWCVPVAEDPQAKAVYHLAVVQVPDRSKIMRALDEAGIGWGIHYPVPCHLQPAYAEFADGPLPVAEAAAEHILSLPVFPTMGTDSTDRVCEVLARV